jgi:hypothetical protein
MKARILLIAPALLAAWPALAQGADDAMHKDSLAAEMVQPPAGHQDVAVPAATRRGMFGMGTMLGTHVIHLTVTGVNEKMGLVEGSYGSTALTLAFPPSSLGVVKVGDHLSVLLSFSK